MRSTTWIGFFCSSFRRGKAGAIFVAVVSGGREMLSAAAQRLADPTPDGL